MPISCKLEKQLLILVLDAVSCCKEGEGPALPAVTHLSMRLAAGEQWWALVSSTSHWKVELKEGEGQGEADKTDI